MTTFDPSPARLAALAVAAISLALSSPAARAQTTVTLDGTSGSNSISTAYTLSGDTTFDLGFFVDYLIVGGGGGGAAGGGAGGGAGGLLESSTAVTGQSYSVVVGAGGTGGAAGGNNKGTDGEDSSALGVTAVGGGAGGNPAGTANSGGSGGGAGRAAASPGDGGSATPGQGFAGGSNTGSANPSAGGGGGAGGAGGNGGSSATAGSGGNGVSSSITGSSMSYAGGGGGSGWFDGGFRTAGVGGSSNGVRTGGNGSSSGTGGAGVSNAGGGGGGGFRTGSTSYGGGNGGSGVVIIRYAGPEIAGVGVGDGVTVSTIGTDDYTVYKYADPAPGTANAFDLSGVDFTTRLGSVLTSGIGGTGNLTYAGPGRLTLAADSSYTGNTIISGGTLQVGSGSTAGTLGSGTVSVASGASLAFDRSDALAVSAAISGDGSLVQQGADVLTLSGTNAYTGGTTLAAGTLALGSADAVGSSGTITFDGGALQFSAANTTDYSPRFATAANQAYRLDTAGQSVAVGTALTSSGGSLTKLGTGTLTLTADNTYDGTTTISAGTLEVGNGGSIGTLGGSGSIANDGTLAVNRDDSVTLSRAVTGTGNLTQAGSGTTILTAANTYSGTTTISAGTLQVGAGGTAGTLGTGGVVNDGSLVFNRSDALAVGNAISGSGSLTKQAAGTLTLSGSNTYSGGTTIAGGTILAAGDTALGSGAVTLSGGGLLLNEGVTLANDITLSAAAGGLRLGGQLTLDVDYLVVAGGGGGAAGGGGGGGAGGVRQGATTVTVQSYPIVVGAGGSGGAAGGNNQGTNGDDSSALGVLSLGGGAGGPAIGSANSGGSGGGAGRAPASPGSGGAGTLGEGNDGGSNLGLANPSAGGGGGAGGVGGNGGSGGTAGSGGTGIASSITGSSVFYGGGGGGSGWNFLGFTTPGSGGSGGGGAGGNASAATATGTAGQANTGGGGGGGAALGSPTTSSYAGGDGGSGIVIIRYAGSQIATGGSVTTVGSDTLHTFSTVGPDTFSIGSDSVVATLTGDITGTGGFTLDTQSTLVLTGTNSYQGDTIISDGVLQVGNNTTTGSLGSGAVTNNAAIVFNRSNALAVANAISGTGSLTQAGSGTLTLSGTNTYSGGTIVSAGTLVGTATSLQGDISNASALVFDDATGGTYTGVISGTGTFEKTGAGNVILSGANTFTGGITVSAGTLSTNAAGRLTATAAPSVASGATLSLGGDQTLAIVTGSGTLDLSAGTLSMGGTTGEFAGTLTGAGDLIKVGAGTLTLSGAASSFTGTTTLSAGSLILADANALGTASVLSMAAGTTLTLNQRTFVGDFDQLGGTIDGPGELVSTLFRTESGTLDVVIADDDAVARGIRKITAGTTTVTAANTFTGTVRVDAGTLALGSGGSFAAASSALVEGGTLDLAGTSTTFTALDGTGGSVALGAGTLTINNAAASDYSGVIAGAGGSLVKTGAGTLTLSGANTFDGGITVSAGRLAGSVASLPGAIANNAELEFNESAAATLATIVSGSGDLIKTGTGTLTIDTAQTFTGTLEVAAGTVDLGGSGSLDSGITLATSGTGTFAVGSNSLAVAGLSGSAGGITLADGTLTVTNASAASYGGAITGSGSLVKAGAGTLTLTGSNAITTGGTGGTIVEAGRLVGTTASVNGRMQIDSGATLELDQATAGTLAGSLVGSGDFEKTGVGNLTVGNTNGSYSGDVTISAGTLTVGSGSGDTFAGLGSGGIVNNATLALNRSNYFFSQAISGTGQVVQVAGNTVINAANSYSGGTVLSGGKVTVQNDAALGTSGTISFEGGTLEYSQALTTDLSSRFSTADNQAYAIEVSAASPITLASALTSTGGTLTKTGNGTLVLSGANTYSGGTTVSAGGLEVTTSSLPGDASVAAGARLDFNQSTVGNYSDVISGQGQLRKRGSGTVTLSGANSYTGGTTILQGTLVGGVANIPGDISLDGIAPGAATLEFDQATDATYTGVISTSTVANTGSVVKSGVGNLILSGANTYTQPTSVAAGRLSVNGSLGTSAVTVQSGGELGGSGILGGTVAVQNGGRLSPGNSIDVLTQGATSFASGATFEYEVDSTDLADLANAADLLVVNGNLDIAAGTLLELTDLAAQAQAFVEDSTVFAMINYTGAWNGGLFTYNGQSLADGSRFSVGSQLWEIDYDFVGTLTEPLNFRDSYVPASGTQTFVTVTAVPEPASLALLAAAAVGLAAVRRVREKLRDLGRVPRPCCRKAGPSASPAAVEEP